jgi:CHAD domain-containing protein
MKRIGILQRAVEVRVRALVHQFHGARAGAVEPLRRTRVATRRLREALPLLGLAASSGGYAPARLADLRAAVRRLTRALGSVRELDVSLQRLDALAAQDASLVPGVAVVRAAIERERQARAAAMRKVLDGIRVKRLARRAMAIARGAVAASPPASRSRRMLLARVARRAGRLDAAIRAAGTLNVPPQLHAVRVAVKRFRYALELVEEMGVARTAAATARLRAAQEVLGELHDLHVLSEYARSVQSELAPDDPLRASLRRLVSVIERDIAHRHAAYLSGRDRVAKLARIWQMSPAAQRRAALAGRRPATSRAPRLPNRVPATAASTAHQRRAASEPILPAAGRTS